MQAEFTTGEAAFLIMVVATFAIFSVTLFLCRRDYDRWLRGKTGAAHRSAGAYPHPAE